MANHEIIPDKITSPIQLLAAWFVALIVLDGAFLTAAGLLSSPTWLPAALVIASIANVPVFLVCMFLLQTRFRPEMQSDEHYSEYLKQRKKTANLAAQVLKQMADAGLGISDLVQGRAMNTAAADKIRPIVEELSKSVKALQDEREPDENIDPGSLRALAHGELGVGNWLAGAQILEKYAALRLNDFEANFSRGVAYANSREGLTTDTAALRAYNDAVTFVPDSIDNNFRARLFTYRGAMLKRMHRFEEALADFRIAEPLASDDDEAGDLLYNFASTYALMGDRENMLATIRRIPPNSDDMRVIQARRYDYFSKFADDPEFLEAIRAS